jgi:hypothetical protein
LREPLWSIAFVGRRIVVAGLAAAAFFLWPSLPVLVLGIVAFVGSLLLDLALNRWNK